MILGIAAATWLRLLLDPLLGTQFPFPTYLFAILFCVWLGGVRPALLAVLLATLALVYFIMPPRGSLLHKGREQQVGLGLFVTMGAGIALLGGRIQQTRERAAELAATELQLRLFVEQAPVSISMFDTDMRYIAASRRWIAEYGRGHAQLVGRSHYEVHADLPERWKEVHRRGMAGETTRCEEDLWQLEDGSKHWLRWSVIPWVDNRGSTGGIIIFAEDITARMRDRELLEQQQQQLREMNEALERRVAKRTAALQAANQELEAFSYSVSHDLRAPLRAIDGFSRIVLERFAAELPPEAQEHLRDIRANTQQMGRLIDDLLSFSKLTRQPLRLQLLNTAELVRDILKILQSGQTGRRVELRIGDLPNCQADPGLIKQVWMNLLDNAMKYTAKRDPAIIEVGCRTDQRPVVYYVQDNGVGFDMRYAHKLFGVFQRLHRGADYEGSGVGLAIVQRIVQRHGGRVWTEAEPERGATFFFTIPEPALPNESSDGVSHV